MENQTFEEECLWTCRTSYWVEDSTYYGLLMRRFAGVKSLIACMSLMGSPAAATKKPWEWTA
jgi:hypothetical protein